MFFSNNSYFKEGWNILDFFVNLGSFLLYAGFWSSLDLSLLRTFRVLKPLKTIASFKMLQIILMALFGALPLLLDVFIILVFFFLVYAIAGLQLFSGVLKYRCMELETGTVPFGSEDVCGNAKCSIGFICVKTFKNISNGIINFDTLLYSFLQVMFIITLDSWTIIMYAIQKGVTNYAWVYFISLVIIGSYLLTNFTLAVIKVKFSQTHKQIMKGETKKKKLEDMQTYDFTLIKKLGLWYKKKPLSNNAEGDQNKIRERPPDIVTINAEALVENNNSSKSISKSISKNSRMSLSPYHSIVPKTFKKDSSVRSQTKNLAAQNSQNSDSSKKLLSKISSNNNSNNNNADNMYRASLISHFEFEEEKENLFKKTIRKTLTTLNQNLIKNFYRFFNYGQKFRRVPKKL